MAHKMHLSLIMVFLATASGQGQTDSIPILDRPESYQRQFVADFLKDGNPTDYVEGYPKTSDHLSDFKLLTNYTDWALPLVEIRLKEWLKEPEANKSAIEKVVGSVAYGGTIRALDFTGRVFSNSAESRKWIKMALNSKFGSPNPNFISTWYYALESSNLLIREVAQETIPRMLDHPSDSTLYTWGEAIIDRYRHEPTTLEILTDPLVELARLHSDIHPEILRQKLAKISKEAYVRRQEEGKKKGR